MADAARSAHTFWATVLTLWLRDMRRFFRQPSRIVGALAQPLIFWVVIGSGFSSSFKIAANGPDYLQYFFPGIVVMVVLFTAIFSTMSVIDDRHAGFLQAVLVAPAPRLALVLGKSLGGTSVALVQCALFLILAPQAGFSFGEIHWPLLLFHLVALALALTALGFSIAWIVDSTQGYHAIMSILLLPMWILSGAMFPGFGERGAGAGWLSAMMRWNPISYGVAGLRRALHGGELPTGGAIPGMQTTATFESLVTLFFMLATVALAGWAASQPVIRTHSRRPKRAKTALPAAPKTSSQ